MSIEVVFEKSRRIETLLKTRGYVGRGLHELVSNAGSNIEVNVARACRKVATVRNKFAHEDGFDLSETLMADFIETADFCIDELNHYPYHIPVTEEVPPLPQQISAVEKKIEILVPTTVKNVQNVSAQSKWQAIVQLIAHIADASFKVR